jgi:hypothetical protein
LTGDGTIQMGAGAELNLDESQILCNLAGPVTMQVDIGSKLTIEGDAVIDLGDPCDPNVRGTIDCNGLLQVKDNVQITDANINVTRASFEDNVSITNSVITVDRLAPPGQFSVERDVNIVNNDIYVNGDRYMDLNPKFFAGAFQNNRIFVTITEGVDQAQGGLFECRGDPCFAEPNYADPCCDPNGFMCRVLPSTIPDCNIRTWTIERMELVKGAKLNVTNRFPFQPPFYPGSDDDVLYVKELILREDSVLNTAYNWVYYGDLQREPNTVITDMPLLGFSLINIAFDDWIEFRVRVTHNNFKHPIDPNYDRNHVTRIEGFGPDPNGMMEMRTILDPDPNSPSCGQVVSAKAKGTFAKASEDGILIRFEYLFVDDPCGEAELILYLSDDLTLDENLVEVCRIRPPRSGRYGSVGSSEPAVFSGTFPKGALDFARGTYIALELRGRGARCRIDNWDPSVECTAICGNFYIDPDPMLEGSVDVYDYLVLLAEFGLSSPAAVGKGCLDIVTDGCINTNDLLAWGIEDVLNKCPQASGLASDQTAISRTSPATQTVGTQNTGGSESLLLLGKPGGSGGGLEVPSSYLYSVDSNGTCAKDTNEIESDGRLVTDTYGNICQINGDPGLIRRDTGALLLNASTINDGNNSVSVGFVGGTGVLLSDAAFNPCDPNIVFVVPVHVTPLVEIGCPYLAAAKLELTGGGDCNLVELYGKNPATDSDQNNPKSICNDPNDYVYEPDVQHIREIEIDSYGNVFVLSAHWENQNNWILIYDEAAGNSSEVRVWLSDPNDGDPNVIAPSAMVVSSHEEKIYLASSVSSSNDLFAEVYCFSIDYTDHNVTGLTYEGFVEINCPEPNVCPSLCDSNLGYVSAITGMIENPDERVLYVTGFTAPKFPAEETLPYGQIEGLFTTPILAVVPLDTNEPAEATEITGSDLALPLSITRPTEFFGGADLTSDNTVDLEDLAILAQYWRDSSCVSPDWCGGADLDKGNAVGWEDVAVLAGHWLESRCSD